MFARSSLLVIFLNFLLTNVKCSGIYYQVENRRGIQKRNNREIDNSPKWMKAISKIKEELLNIQAIIAKDEELQHNCMTVSQKSEKRHLMCVGSILTDRHVLTSATCIHEATHIRHNIKAPLVVVIAPLKSNPQVIRVNSYRVHPEHSVFPYNQQHTKHNVAVIKLACSIATEHLTKIELPKAPYTEICSSDNCMVAILRRVGQTSIVIYDTRAKHIPLTSRKRRSIEMVKKLGNGTTTEILPANIGEKWRETSRIFEPLLLVQKKEVQEILPQKNRKEIDFSQIAKNGRDLEFQKRSDFLELGSNSKDVPFEKLGMLISGKKINSRFRPIRIREQRKVFSPLEEISTTTNIGDQYVFQGDSDQNYRVRLFSVRASNGFQGCPQSGSPVMFEKTQAAIVSISCDDRQSGVSWKYTDVFLNSDWITGITANWDSEYPIRNQIKSNKTASISGCSTCIYNFFIDLTGSNDKTKCSDLNKDSNEFKMCASHNGQRMMNKQTSIPETDKQSSSKVPLQKPNEQRGSRQFSTSQKVKNKVFHSGNEKNQNLDKKSSKISKIDPSIKFDDLKGLKSNLKTEKKDIDKHTRKNIDKNAAKDSAKVFPLYLTKNMGTDVSKDYDKDFGSVLKMNFDQDFDKDFEKKLQREFQQDFKKDYYSRNMELSNRNRLRKQIAGNHGHESSKLNEYKNRKFSKVVQTAMNPQKSVNYNPLSKKFHNLKMMLARIEKSISEKNIEKVVFRGQRKILPQMEISNSGRGIEYFREEKPVVDRQFSVLFMDRERGASNRSNAYQGFNGYFL